MPIKYLLLFAALCLPGLANASVLNPANGNSWDLYVFGNGRVIYDILMGVKMLMVPDAGETGFSMLLLLLATIGFIVLAAAAGFDPAKNLRKMFGYLLMVWMVSLFTTRITANVTVNDLVVNGDGIKEVYVAEKVPALVAVPAALTSQVGYYFTRVIETYFTVPDVYKMSGASAGQFNLFAKMVDESNSYGFRYPELKQSLSAYTADCVVPAMAMMRLTGPGKDGQPDLKGIEALTRSTNLIKTYESAKHNAIMTTYYPIQSVDFANTAPGPNVGNAMGGMGTLLSCDKAYDSIKSDMEKHAQALLERGTDAWKKAGIMVPFETAFKTMLLQASASGSVNASFSSPSGYIMQQGFLNSMSGAFRQAAIQTGNNELMQAAAISQAEANQRSTWVAGFQTFNNMMGYVFTVLQAFIFAVTPMIVVALLVPGLGRGIFVNYAQILVWLTLWMPMLALINFIITLFSGDSGSAVLGLDGGLSYNNKGLFVEKNKDAVIAAQFLGTMTPMLSWGIVKGAMAFTEFINHGIGSQFASQAGVASSTGNMSMGNMSLDNVGANKYSTAFSSQVGFQSVNAFAGVGSMTAMHDQGGQGASVNAKAVDAGKQMSEGVSSRIAESKSAKDSLQNTMTNSKNFATAISELERSGSSAAHQRVLQQVKQDAETYAKTHGVSEGQNLGETKASSHATDKNQGGRRNVSVGAEAGLGGSFGPVKAGVTTRGGTEGFTGESETNALQDVKSTAGSRGINDSLSRNQQASLTSSDTTTDSVGSSHERSIARSKDESAALQMSLAHALAMETSYSQSLESMRSLSNSHSVASGIGYQGVNDLLSEMDSIRSSSPSVEAMQARFSALEDRVRAGGAQTMAAYEGVRSRASGMDLGGGSGLPASSVGANVDAFKSSVTGEMGKREAAIKTEATTRGNAVKEGQKTGAVDDNALFAMAKGSPIAKMLNDKKK